MSKRIDTATKRIHAPAAAIYAAFASAEAMAAWLPPKGMKGEMLKFSFRDGGGYRMRLTYSEAERFCCAKFASKRPAGRVEVIDGDIVDDSMGMFAARNEDGDKRYGRIDAHEILLSFTGGKLAPLEWTHYEIGKRLNP